MREQQFHICHSNTFHRIEITSVSIAVAANHLIKQKAIDILRS